MSSNDGGSSFNQKTHDSAAEIARKKVLAVYSSTIESLKKFPHNKHSDQYIAPPVPGAIYSRHEDHTVEEKDPSAYPTQIFSNQISPLTEATPDYQTTDTTSSLKDTPISQAVVTEEWQQYHSAWQNYYQNYYSEYYAKAAQSYLATEKLKSERIASGKAQHKRRLKHLTPILVAIVIVLGILFLQYNRLIIAPIMAYVSPNSGEVTSSIEAVDPSITQAVSPDPRLIIPKLNIDVPVAFNISTNDVMSAMNHGIAQFKIPGANALPGQIGNLVLSGHSAGDLYSSNPYKFIFSGLERLENGDLIYINYESVRYTYQMTKREVVEPSNVAALVYETDKPMLTLITCTPLGTSRYRLLITAEQISPSYDTNNRPSDSETPTTPDLTMPSNEPSFFENLWSNLFGS